MPRRGSRVRIPSRAFFICPEYYFFSRQIWFLAKADLFSGFIDRIGGRFLPPIRLPRYPAHLAALPLDDRCPPNVRWCKHRGRLPGVSQQKKAIRPSTLTYCLFVFFHIHQTGMNESSRLSAAMPGLYCNSALRRQPAQHIFQCLLLLRVHNRQHFTVHFLNCCQCFISECRPFISQFNLYVSAVLFTDMPAD